MKRDELSQYVRRSELPEATDVSGFARLSDIPDVSKFAKRDELPAIPDVSEFAKKQEMHAALAETHKSTFNHTMELTGRVDSFEKQSTERHESVVRDIETVNSTTHTIANEQASLAERLGAVIKTTAKVGATTWLQAHGVPVSGGFIAIGIGCAGWFLRRRRPGGGDSDRPFHQGGAIDPDRLIHAIRQAMT